MSFFLYLPSIRICPKEIFEMIYDSTKYFVSTFDACMNEEGLESDKNLQVQYPKNLLSEEKISNMQVQIYEKGVSEFLKSNKAFKDEYFYSKENFQNYMNEDTSYTLPTYTSNYPQEKNELVVNTLAITDQE